MTEETHEETDEATETHYSSIRFFIDDDKLKAEFTADSIDTPLEQVKMLEQLKTEGFAKHNFDEETILSLLEHSQNNKSEIITIEDHKDAEFELIVDALQFQLSIKISPALSGEDLNYDDILANILESKVDESYIDKTLLASVIFDSKDSLTEVPPIIASGIAAIDGQDSSFEILFQTDTKTGPKKDASGAINHYETQDYISVQIDQSVMKRIPHTLATTGKTIYGEDLNGEDGLCIEFAIDDTVKVDTSDDNILVAVKKGHPVASDTGVHIDDTLTIKNASLHSGNIYFDGSVLVTGEVMPNVVIEASGDIHVQGMVENASLIAGNDITVCAGIQSSQLFDHNNADDDYTPDCTIVAQGSIRAKYCNSIKATAKKDILIETYTMHSQLQAGNQLIVGDNNGKGVIIGGMNAADFGIKANIVGSDAYVATHLDCGLHRKFKQLYKKTLGALARTRSELSLLESALNKIKNMGSPTKVGSVVLKKAKLIHKEITYLKQKYSGLEKKLKSTKAKVDKSKTVTIEIEKKLHPNVHITINNVNTVNNREREKSTVGCEDYEIQFN